jgi:hypothetical protein
MRKETVTVNADGSYTVKGSGWFWVRLKRAEMQLEGGNFHVLSVLEMAPGMLEKKASKLFISQAKLTIQKHFP